MPTHAQVGVPAGDPRARGSRAETDWTSQERATLLFVRQADRVLLIRKKRGLSAGKLNGLGGRLDDGESPRQVFTYPMARIGLLEMCDNLGRSPASPAVEPNH